MCDFVIPCRTPPGGGGSPSELRYFGVFGGFLRYFGPNEDLGTFSDFRYLENELYIPQARKYGRKVKEFLPRKVMETCFFACGALEILIFI